MYDELCEKGYGENIEVDKKSRFYGKGFRITPFSMKDNNYPGEGFTKNIFIPVPKYLENDDAGVISAVNDKLKHLSEWDIIPNKSWAINVPIKSREKGGVTGGCFILFEHNISIEKIAMVRILLTDTYWPDQLGQLPVILSINLEQERSSFRCFWARDRKNQIFKNNALENIIPNVTRTYSDVCSINSKRVIPKPDLFPKSDLIPKPDLFPNNELKIKSVKNVNFNRPASKVDKFNRPNFRHYLKRKDNELINNQPSYNKKELDKKILIIPVSDQPSLIPDNIDSQD